MLSTRTIAILGALLMVTATATAAKAQGKDKRHAKDEDDEDDDETENDRARTAKAKAKAKDEDDDETENDRARKTKAKAKAKDEGDDDDETERDRARKAKAKAKAKSEDDDDDDEAEKEKERQREKVKAKAKAKAEEEEVAKEAGGSSGGGSTGADEAYHDGTLGFSIPFTVISGAVGGAGGEPVPTVDLVYFLDDQSALDLIVGLNVHRKQTTTVTPGPPPMTTTSTANLIGVAGGMGYRMYSVKNSLRSFIEPQAVISWPDTSSTAALGVNLGVSLGLERNITPWFSVSAALGAALNLTNSFKDIQLATTGLLAANLYWH